MTKRLVKKYSKDISDVPLEGPDSFVVTMPKNRHAGAWFLTFLLLFVLGGLALTITRSPETRAAMMRVFTPPTSPPY